MRAVWLIAKSVLVEAVRRKEIYAVILAATGVILIAGTIRFFGYEGMSKFYREVSLKIMNLATALTVIFLAARQLPREFESKTIYPLLAKPVGRWTFLMGKVLGVLLAGSFCYGLFILLFAGGMKYIGADLEWDLFIQAVYLQLLALSMLAGAAFLLSLLLNVDAAVTVTVLLFALGGTLSSALDYTYDSIRAALPFTVPWVGGAWSTSVGEILMRLLNYTIPQFSLFDLSSKVVHGNKWGPVGGWVIGYLTLYALVFLSIYLFLAYQLFRRRPL